MIRSEMLAEAKDLNFERAAELRDELRMLEEFLEGRVGEKPKKTRKKKRTEAGKARTAKLQRRASRSRKYRG